MTWIRSLVAGGCALAFGALGCSDPQEDCFVEGCGDDMVSWPASDGGEVRAENFIAPNGTSHTLLTAHFYDAQIGQMTFPSFGAGDNGELDCNWVGGTSGDGATENPAPEKVFPFGDASGELGVTATFAPGGRHYLDVGDTVSLQAEGKDAIVLQRYRDHLTPFAGGSFHSIVYDPAPSPDPSLAIPAELMGGDGAIEDGQRLSITLSGGADVPYTEWNFEGEDSGIEIPPRPVILASRGNAIDWSQTGAPMASQELVRDASDTFTYDVPGSVDPDLLGLVAIYQTEPTFEITHFCVHGHPGRVTITPELKAQMPPHGMIVVSNFYHRLQSIESPRRVDLVGVASTSSLYTLVDP